MSKPVKRPANGNEVEAGKIGIACRLPILEEKSRRTKLDVGNFDETFRNGDLGHGRHSVEIIEHRISLHLINKFFYQLRFETKSSTRYQFRLAAWPVIARLGHFFRRQDTCPVTEQRGMGVKGSS